MSSQYSQENAEILKGMIDHGVLIPMQKKTNIDVEVYGYNNSYFSGDQDVKKSIARYIFMIEGALISWSSRKKRIMAFSSCEVVYVDASYATCQAT